MSPPPAETLSWSCSRGPPIQASARRAANSSMFSWNPIWAIFRSRRYSLPAWKPPLHQPSDLTSATVDPYLPRLADILPLCVTWAVGGSLLLAGAGLTGNRGPPEFHIAAGWGGLCLLLTSWGVFVPLRMQLPAAAFVIAALTMMSLPKRRPSAGAWVALGKMLAVSLPLWLVMAPIRPSQPDTFLNLLPNAFYLVDYGLLPTAARPTSYSLLPAAPYNTQFLSFLASLLDADYPTQGMTLVNVMLQLVAGLAIARALGPPATSSARPPGWGLTALGFLLATLLN